LFGGAIATDGSVTVWQSFFFGNHAPAGGAIAVSFGDSLSLEKSALFNNTGTGEAGASALQIYDGDVHVLNTTFAHNDALDAGATVMIDVGDLVLEHATLALNDSANGANGLYVGPSANATSYSTMYSNAANDCDVTGGWTVDTSMDETGTCPGAFVAASQPVGACTNNNDYQSFCDTSDGHGIATCYASEDQLGTARHPTDCWIGAFEAP